MNRILQFSLIRIMLAVLNVVRFLFTITNTGLLVVTREGLSSKER